MDDILRSAYKHDRNNHTEMLNHHVMFYREGIVLSLVTRLERKALTADEFQREFANLTGSERIAVLERMETAEALSYFSSKIR